MRLFFVTVTRRDFLHVFLVTNLPPTSFSHPVMNSNNEYVHCTEVVFRTFFTNAAFPPQTPSRYSFLSASPAPYFSLGTFFLTALFAKINYTVFEKHLISVRSRKLSLYSNKARNLSHCLSVPSPLSDPTTLLNEISSPYESRVSPSIPLPCELTLSSQLQ